MLLFFITIIYPVSCLDGYLSERQKYRTTWQKKKKIERKKKKDIDAQSILLFSIN